MKKTILLALAVLLLGSGIILFYPTPSFAQTQSVAGNVTEPDGVTAVANAGVQIRNGNWTVYQWTNTDANGNFVFNDLSADNYTIEIWGYHDSYENPSQLNTYYDGSTIVDLGTIRLLAPLVILTLTKSDGTTPVVGVWANLRNDSYTVWKYDQTDANGQASFGLDTNGTYVIEINEQYGGESPPADISFTYSGTPLTLSAKYAGPNVAGYVKKGDGTVCTSSECSISIYKSDWSSSYWVNPDSNGYFSLNISSSGTYKVNIQYWGGGVYSAPDPASITIDANTTNDLGTFYLQSPNITGKLLTPTGDAVANAWFDFHSDDWSNYKNGSTGTDGSFGIAVSTVGTYTLQFWLDSTFSDYSAPAAQSINYTGTALNLGNIYLGSSMLKGKVTDESGNPLAWASVDLHDRTYNWENSWWGSTNASGEFTLNKTLTAGTYYLIVNPPWDQSGLLPSSEITVELTAGQTNTTYYDSPIVLGSAHKTISGTVKKPDGTKVSNAQVQTWAMGGKFSSYAWDQTDANGNYSLSVGAGSYEVNVWPFWDPSGTSTPDWGSPEPQYIEFEGADSVSETATANFTVAVYDAILTGKMVMPNGDPLSSSVSASVDAWQKGGRMGNWAQAQSDGTFTLSLASGYTYEVSIWAWGSGIPSYGSTTGYGSGGDEYAGPTIDPVILTSGQTYDLGTLALVEKNAHITGKVTDTNGVVISGAYVNAWSMSAAGWGWDMTDENGDYDMLVFGGDYSISAFPGWDSTADSQGASYVPITSPQEVSVGANQTIPDINFQMGIADATISGRLMDSAGNSINSWGWVNASNSADTYTTGDMWWGGFLGGSVSGGQFEFMVPAGKYELNVFMDWNADYIQNEDVIVEIASGGSEDVTITMIPTNSTISGEFKDSAGNVITGLWGEVFANRADGGSVFSLINANGTYSLKVAAGTWKLNYFIDPYSGSSYLPGALESNTITVGDDEDVIMDLTVLAADSEISGTVTDEDDTAIAGVPVYASLDYAGQERSDDYADYGFDSLETTTDAEGNFTLDVPEGDYYLHASLPPEEGYIFSGAEQVYTSPADPAEDIEMIFETADAQISGTITLDSAVSDAFVYAYTEGGGYSEATTDNGTYSIAVTSDETWNIGAIDEEGNSYYLSEQAEVMVDELAETQDLALEYQGEMPDPVSTTFDATLSKTIELSDGFAIEAPARAFEDDDTVTVTVEPVAEVAYQTGSQPLGGYGYDITVRDDDGTTISSFNSNVNMELPYNEEDLADLGLEDAALDGEYYDSTAGIWEKSSSQILDEDQNKLIVQTDHFSVFSPVTPGVSSQSGAQETLTLTVVSPEEGAIVTTDLVLVSGTVSDADASVTIRLNSVEVASATVNSQGAFSESVASLLEGENTIQVNAIKGILTADAVTRIVVYTPSEVSETPIDTATGIAYDIVVMTGEDSAPHIRVFDSSGSLLYQFFAFSETARGKFRVLTADVNGDGEMEIVAWPEGEGFGPQVRIFKKDGTLLAQEIVLNEGYRGGIAVLNNADFDGDGRQDFAVVPQGGGGVNLRLYKYNAQTGAIDLLAWTLPYQDAYQGKVNLAIADVTGDGVTDIIVSPLEGGPNIRVYHYDVDKGTIELDDWFMAYQEEYRDGVLIATGDVTGDGISDIVTYPEENAGANVRAYRYDSADSSFALIDWIQPYSDEWRGSLTVKVVDLDKDGDSEIAVVPATGGGPNLRVYSYNSTSNGIELSDWEMVMNDDFRGGIELAVSNLDGDDFRELVVYPRGGGGPNLRVYEYNADGELTLIDWTFAYEETFRGEMSIKAADLDGDGSSSLIVSPISGGGPNVRIYHLAQGNLKLSDWFMAYGDAFRGGVLAKFIN